jgi:hypothetical protein
MEARSIRARSRRESRSAIEEDGNGTPAADRRASHTAHDTASSIGITAHDAM